jgi:hypothetical protein
MSDLIERLRHAADCQWKDVVDDCQEAADEIERLREQVVNLQTRNNALYEAIDILKRGGKLK